MFIDDFTYDPGEIVIPTSEPEEDNSVAIVVTAIVLVILFIVIGYFCHRKRASDHVDTVDFEKRHL